MTGQSDLARAPRTLEFFMPMNCSASRLRGAKAGVPATAGAGAAVRAAFGDSGGLVCRQGRGGGRPRPAAGSQGGATGPPPRGARGSGPGVLEITRCDFEKATSVRHTRDFAPEITRCGFARSTFGDLKYAAGRYEVTTSFVGQIGPWAAHIWQFRRQPVRDPSKKTAKAAVLGAFSRSGCRGAPKMHVGCTRFPPMHPEAPRNRQPMHRWCQGTRSVHTNSRASPTGANVGPDARGTQADATETRPDQASYSVL